MLALRVSFINEVSELCEKAGANIDDVSYGMGLDDRIGPKFLKAGIGYGGSCFPKDIRAFEKTLKDNGCRADIIENIELVNERQLMKNAKRAEALVGKLDGKTVAIWGLSFKPNTDDVRESPAIRISSELLRRKAKLRVYDPKGMDNAKKVLGNSVEYCRDPYSAALGSDLLIIATEWDEFLKADLKKTATLMKSKNLFDGRNIFNPEKMRALGFNYICIGK